MSFSETHDNAHFNSPSFTSPGTLTLAGGTDYSLVPGTIYSFSINTFAPNGNIRGVADSVTGSWNYGYDAMNRLISGNSTAGQCSGMNITWNYDPLGNRWGQGASGSGTCTINQPSYSFSSGNNRIDGWSYDQAGNLLNDGVHNYAYDAENRIATVDATTKYIYDADGRRVAKLQASNGAVLSSYVIGLDDQQVTELAGSGQWISSNVYSDEGLTATYDTTAVHFHVFDWLKTRRVQPAADGIAEGSFKSFPFGDGFVVNGIDSARTHFAGTDHDAETELDFAGARYYRGSLGRFLSADDPFEDQWGDEPQSWNLYVYARNNPVINVDPNGQSCVTSDDGIPADDGDGKGCAAAGVDPSKDPAKPKPEDIRNDRPLNVVDSMPTDLLPGMANFFAGMGDSLTFGGTGYVRRLLGVDFVDICSGAYAAGEYTEIGGEILLTAGSAALKQAAKGATRAAVRQAARRQTRNIARMGNELHHVNPLFGHPGGAATLFPTGGLPASIHSGWLNTKLLSKAAHSAAHLRMQMLEKIGAAAVNPVTTGARAARAAGGC